ncbi:MAG: hypothetical protein RLZZ351_625 [Pseudomonadota bacterium]|jgi:hypothetical protein
MMALQVQTDGLKNKRPPEGSLVFCMVRPKRFELLTPWFVAKYSIQLSYGRVRRELYANLVLFPAEIKQFCDKHTSVWRRARDSNPRYRFKPVCFLSREVPSTTRPALRFVALLRGRNDTRLRPKNQCKFSAR